MKVIHTIASTRLDHGGTSRSVPATCEALAAAAIDVDLITARPADESIACNVPAPPVITHWARESRRWRQWGVGRQFVQLLAEAIDSANHRVVVHDHAIWLPTNHAVAAYCRRHKLTRVVSPRGMLGDWAMKHGGWKKRIAWRGYQCRDLETATAFHATSELEADEIRALGFSQPIAVIPNGILLPKQLPDRQPTVRRQALFLSRIHAKKGLVNLVRAWGRANPSSDWDLVIAGPDEGGHQAEIEHEVRRVGLEKRIRFIGELDSDSKWQAYANSELFVLPSYSENFGIVIAEAMAAGLPVITTTGTPWNVLHDRNLGWWIEPSEDALTLALSEACAMSPETLASMGKRARDYAIKTFSWTDVANRLRTFYEHLLESK